MRSTLKPFLAIFAAILLLGAFQTARAAAGTTITDHAAAVSFPDKITFSAHVANPDGVARVVLEYGVDKLTCGTVTARAFPDMQPGTSVDVTWTWEMQKSGSEPPGSHIWYRWRATDRTGQETVSDTQRVTWLDKVHAWQSVSQGKLTLHWYSGTHAFAQDLVSSAATSLARLGQTTGVTLDTPVDLYIYANQDDMRQAILYSPGWTGGEAFPASHVVIIGISPADAAWGKRTEAHELTHVLVGQRTFSCLESIPTWLNEGIAVYGEGGLEASSSAQLAAAVKSDSLISVRALSGGFSEHPAKADLSYSESYSVVNYLIAKYGQAKMIALFDNLSRGMKIDDALGAADGLTLETLEDGWRAQVGAPPRRTAGSAATATVEPTTVPTYQPISGVPLPPTNAPAVAGTALPATPPATATGTALPISANGTGAHTGSAGNGTDPLVLPTVGCLVVLGALVAGRLRRKAA